MNKNKPYKIKIMFKAEIKIKEVQTEGTISLVTLKLKLENKALAETNTFKITSTGSAIVVSSEHGLRDLQQLLSWMNLPSLDEDNLRDNAAEVRAIVREAIKANEKLEKIKTL